MRKMDKQEFKEMMAEAKEAEREEASVVEEVEYAINNDTGKEVTRLAEEKKPRKRRAKKRVVGNAPAWQRHINDCISLICQEAEEKIKQARALQDEADELLNHAQALGGMIK